VITFQGIDTQSSPWQSGGTVHGSNLFVWHFKQMQKLFLHARLHTFKSAAFELWRVPGSRMRKRMALRHALLANNSQRAADGKHAELQIAAAAVVSQLAALATGEQGVCK
jgi:hypothetical protein